MDMSMYNAEPKSLLYPRRSEGDGTLVNEDQMVGYREHLANNHRILFLTGTIRGETEACNLLFALDSISNEPIKLFITSGGGSLDGAFFIYDAFKLLKSPIYTLGRYVASAATLILTAGTKRYLLPHAKVMLHLPFSQFQGDAADLEIHRSEVRKYKDAMLDIYQASGVKHRRAKILRDINREFWLNPQEAIDYGLADEIIKPETVASWLA